MKMLYNKNDKKEIRALIGFVPGKMEKIMKFLLASTLQVC